MYLKELISTLCFNPYIIVIKDGKIIQNHFSTDISINGIIERIEPSSTNFNTFYITIK